MNAIEMQMIGLFRVKAEPIAKRYNIRLDIDWNTGGIAFVTEKEISQIELKKFLTEMTAVIQQYPILKEWRC